MSEFKNDFSLNEVRKHWNKVAKEYDSSNKEHEEMHNQRWVEALKHLDLKPDTLILDIYCRTADAIKFFTRKCEEITIVGTELSEGMLEEAKKKYPQGLFVQASPHALPYKNNCFDVVLSLETLEHVSDPLVFLSEINRISKSDGKLIMSLPPYTAEYISILTDLFHFHHGEGPHKFLPSKIVKKMIEMAGLKLVKHKGTVLIPVGPQFLRSFASRIENKIQNTPLREFCIRQFYICEKKLMT